jgi:hypothetical protein
VKPSTRFLVPIVALALLAGAVVWPRWLRPNRVDTCAHPDVLGVTGLIPGSKPEGEDRTRLDEDNVQWSEGLVEDPAFPREPLAFRIVRSFNVLKAAEHPLGLMPARVEAETVRMELRDAPGGPLPVYLVRSSGREAFRVVAYTFLFGNEPTARPFVEQLRGAIRELREGRRPLTILLAGGAANAETAPHREEVALRWIDAAWAHYRSMCLEAGGAVRKPGDAAAGGPP